MKHSHYQYPNTCYCPSCSNVCSNNCSNGCEKCHPCDCPAPYCCNKSCLPCCKPPIIVGPTGPQGNIGPTGATSPTGMARTYYSQYVLSERIPNFPDITLMLGFESVQKTELINPTTIQLEPGYIYQISYTILGTPGADSYFQILPYLNSIPQPVYAATGVSNTASEGNTHVSATFITNVALTDPATLSFRLSTSSSSDVGLLGAISIEVIA